MEDVERYRRLAALRVEQLTDEDETLRGWLKWVRRFGWPLLVLALVCPVAAGSVSVSDVLMAGESKAVAAAVLSFLGAAAVALHRGLHCETYQQALKRTIQSVRSITEDFEVIAAAPEADVPSEYRKAEARLRELRATSSDLPPRRRRKLRERLGEPA
jgi:hypothetical protein